MPVRYDGDEADKEIHPGIWAQMKSNTTHDPVLGLALEADAPSVSYPGIWP